MIVFIQSSLLGLHNGTAESLFYELRSKRDGLVFIEFMPHISDIIARNPSEVKKFIKIRYTREKNSLIISTLPILPIYGLSPYLWYCANKIVARYCFEIIKTNLKKKLGTSSGLKLLIFNPLIYGFIKGSIDDDDNLYYYILDDWPDLIRNPLLNSLIRRLETKLINDSRACFSVSTNIKKRLEIFSSNIYVIPNGVRTDFSNNLSGKYNFIKDGRPIIGFVGLVGHWVDVDLILAVAKKFAGCKIIIAGNDKIGLIRKIREEHIDNIYYMGPVAYSDVPDLISVFDICINPFDQSYTSLNSCPIKIYEYLALGKQVVTSNIEAIERELKDYVFISNSKAEFIKYIELILKKEIKKPQIPIDKISWSARAREIEEIIESCSIREPHNATLGNYQTKERRLMNKKG